MKRLAVLSNPPIFAPRCFIESQTPDKEADVAKLADALDLGSSAARRVGSTPSIRTDCKKRQLIVMNCLFFMTSRVSIVFTSMKYPLTFSNQLLI